MNKKAAVLTITLCAIVSMAVIFTNATPFSPNQNENAVTKIKIQFWIDDSFLELYTKQQIDNFLISYVKDSNSVFAKNTRLELDYDPADENRFIICS